MPRLVPIEQVNTWATPRLLRYFKSIRRSRIAAMPLYDEHPVPEYEQLCEYSDKLQAILNTREHVRS